MINLKKNKYLLQQSLLIAGVLSGVWLADNGYAQDSVYLVPVQDGTEEHSIKMRYIPAGLLPYEDLGKVERVSSEEAKGKPIEIEPFYISETELTFAQIQNLLPIKAWEEIRSIIQEIKQPPELAESVNTPGFPAFLLHMGDIAAICDRLTARENLVGKNTQNTIENKRFRIPAYFEWQYACRGVTDLLAAEEYPFFCSWAKFNELDVIDQGRIKDGYEKIYQREFKPDNKLGLSQNSTLELCDALAAEGSTSESVSILNAFLQKAIGIERDFTKPASHLYPAIGGSPNRWGLQRMHGNLSEWTLLAKDLDEVSFVWDELITKRQESSRKCVVLAGGGFTETLNAEGAWRTFSMRGGVPNQLPKFLLEPYEISATFDREQVSRDRYPGIRLVMERVIRDDWFSIVRSSILLKSEKARAEESVADIFRNSINELAVDTESENMHATIAIYEQLAEMQESPDESLAVQVFSSAIPLTNLFKEDEDPALSEGLAAIAALDLGGLTTSDNQQDKSGKSKKAESEPKMTSIPDRLYFELSAELAALNATNN